MSNFKMKIVDKHNGSLNSYFEVQINVQGTKVSINSYPFGNCQNFSIGYFSNLIGEFGASKLFDKIKELKELCGFSKPFVVVDLRQDDIELSDLRKVLTVVRSSAYENANNTLMRIVVIDTRRKP